MIGVIIKVKIAGLLQASLDLTAGVCGAGFDSAVLKYIFHVGQNLKGNGFTGLDTGLSVRMIKSGYIYCYRRIKRKRRFR